MNYRLIFLVWISHFAMAQNKIPMGVQDPQWSLFSANPLAINPAFTGESGGVRLMSSNRWQWFNFKGINTYSMSLDSPISNKLNAGVQLTSDNQANSINSQNGHVLFSINFPEQSKIEKTAFQLAIKIGGLYQSYGNNVSKLFADQIQVGSNQLTIGNSSDPLKTNNVSTFKPDFSLGGIFKFIDNNTREELPLNWIGFSLDHFQKVLTGGPIIYPKYSFQFGRISSFDRRIYYRGRGNQIDLEQTKSFTFNFYKQGPMSQVAFGWNYLSYPLIYGVWLRGNLLKSFKTQTRESVIFITGLQQKKWMLQYAFDLTTSSLSLANTYGSHEISVWYSFDATLDLGNTQLQRKRRLKCNRF
jgi:type IX secretion system PorP/SprF family membrane protein